MEFRAHAAGTERQMRYLKILWHHTADHLPVVIFSEIDDAGWEVRKVCHYRIGPPGYASETEAARSEQLSDQTTPALEEIAKVPRLEPREISKQEFEEIWLKAHEAYS